MARCAPERARYGRVIRRRPSGTADCIASEDAHNKTKATGPVARADPCLRRSRAVLGWEGAMIELDGIASVADVARVQALRRGSAPALLFDGRSTTFAEVDATASRLPTHSSLLASGRRSGSPISARTPIISCRACSASARRARRSRRSTSASPPRRSPACSRIAARGSCSSDRMPPISPTRRSRWSPRGRV